MQDSTDWTRPEARRGGDWRARGTRGLAAAVSSGGRREKARSPFRGRATRSRSRACDQLRGRRRQANGRKASEVSRRAAPRRSRRKRRARRGSSSWRVTASSPSWTSALAPPSALSSLSSGPAILRTASSAGRTGSSSTEGTPTPSISIFARRPRSWASRGFSSPRQSRTASGSPDSTPKARRRCEHSRASARSRSRAR